MSAARTAIANPVALVMTRPQDASIRFVSLLPDALQADLTIIYAPLLQITPWAEPVSFDGYKGVIFSSANAVSAVGCSPNDFPAFCVGKRTCQVAKDAGWAAHFGGATADELVQWLATTLPEAPLLHLHGKHTRGDIAARLTAIGLPCNGIISYEQQLLPLTAAALREIDAQNSVIVPLFSPRTARHFASLGLDQKNLSLIALSEAVADELKDLKCNSLQVSKAPNADSMIDMVRDAAHRLAHLESGNPAQ